MSQPSNNSKSLYQGPGLLVLVTVVLIGTVAFLQYFPGPGKPVPKDFAQYYIAGKVILQREGDALYFTDVFTAQTTESFPESRFGQIGEEVGLKENSYYVYPPWVAILYAPLTVFSPYRALVIVYVLSWVMTVAAFAWLARALPAGGWLAAAAGFILLCLTESFSAAVRAGQASIPMLLLLVLFARALWSKREGQAGMWLALMTGIKVFPLLFLPYLVVFRRWRALIAFGVTGVLLLGLSILLAGVDAHVRYLGLIMEYVHISTPLGANQSLTGFLLRLGDSTVREWSVVPIPAAVAWTSRILMLLWLGLTLWIIMRLQKSHGPWREPLAFSLMSILVFSGSPIVWSHHLLSLAVPFVVAVAFLGVQRSGGAPFGYLTWGVAWAGVLLFNAYFRLPRVYDDVLAIRLLASLPLAGSLVLYSLLFALSKGYSKNQVVEQTLT